MKSLVRDLRAFVYVAAVVLSLVFCPCAFAGSAETTAAPADMAEIEENYEAARKNMENIYYHALDEMSSENGVLDKNMPFGKWVYMQFYRAYDTFSEMAPYLCGISFFLGTLLMFVAQGNKRVQKFALVYLMILIPLGTLVLIVAVGASPLFKRLY